MDENENKVNEPAADYVKPLPDNKRSITFFKSFEEAELHGLKEMAAHSHAQRLINLEIIRKRTYAHLLLPNGEWPPLKRVITIEKGSIE